jgi:uncharacterized membrane protein
MTLGKKTVFSLLLGVIVLTNVLNLTHTNILYTTTLLSFCTCLLLPGLLISFLLRIKRLTMWENILIIVGLSIAFLELDGLLVNILLPIFGVGDPLAWKNILIGFDVGIAFVCVIAWLRTKEFTVQVYVPRCAKLEKILYGLPLCFPMLAILGAIMLNNGGSNILTLILLGGIACYVLLLVLFQRRIAMDLYPYAIFCIGIATLLTTSLRGWYITGHDIEREFYTFRLTNSHHMWKMAFYQDPYNACLSITIFPTLLTHLLLIQDIYVYKVIFQILFATSPVAVFFIVRNYTTPVISFLSSFMFISFPTFFNDMAMLNRQEIGFIFFGLMLYMMLNCELSLVKRRILFTLFGFGIIVSHYSTNFVLLPLITFVYILTLVLSRSTVKKAFAALAAKSPIKIKNRITYRIFLSWPIIVLLFFVTYLWNTVYTNSSDHTDSVLAKVINGVFVKSSQADKSSDIAYSLLSSGKNDPEHELQVYIKRIRPPVEKDEDIKNGASSESEFYSKAITDNYPSYPVQQERLALTALGEMLSSWHVPVFDIQAALRSLAAASMQIFVVVGLVIMILFKGRKEIDVQYMLLCFGAVFLLVLIIIMPFLSIEYGLLRMFQQLLFFLSLPIVVGFASVVFFLKEQRRVLFAAIMAVIFFLTLTGFLSHLTGDYYPQMTLDNTGIYYDAYYVNKSNVLAIAWLAKKSVKDEPVGAGLSGITKILAYGGIIAMNEIFPAIIRKDAYVYLEVSNNVIVSIGGDVLIFNSPKRFLDDNKNILYNNGKTTIYR